MTVRKPIIAGGAAALLCCLLGWNLHSQQPDLRDRIDKLIAEVRLTPTDETNGRERAIIVDEWASYLSHQGIVIPQLLLTNVATFKLNIFPMPIDPHRTLDWNIEELALKNANVARFVADGVKKVIVVPGKLVNIVV